jgi:hypothetical protein
MTLRAFERQDVEALARGLLQAISRATCPHSGHWTAWASSGIGLDSIYVITGVRNHEDWSALACAGGDRFCARVRIGRSAHCPLPKGPSCLDWAFRPSSGNGLRNRLHRQLFPKVQVGRVKFSRLLQARPIHDVDHGPLVTDETIGTQRLQHAVYMD